jgi:transposase-like protein
MMYVRYPLSLRNVEDLLHERGIDITHETVRFWRNRFGTIFAAEIRRNRVQAMRAFRVNQERFLISRQIFKDRRTAALTAWRQLCAA